MPTKSTRNRPAARNRAAIPQDVLEGLNSGRRASANLAEGLAVDQAELLRAIAPELPDEAIATMRDLAGVGVTRRMSAAASILLEHCGPSLMDRLTGHASDTAQGWAAYAIGLMPDLSLAERLERVRPLADDPHFGVREWAWIGIRQHIAADIETAVTLLTPWTSAASPYLRRFATEATRPRGVWAAHIGRLKDHPGLGLPLLVPLRADLSTYVQDSVANWLNDAAKSRPDWVTDLCASWLEGDPAPSTLRICKRAQRSL